jgi:HSP20 family protein
MGSEYRKRPRPHAIVLTPDTLEPGIPGPVSAHIDLLGEAHPAPMDVFETVEAVVVEIDLPGVEKDDIAVLIHGRTLVVEGKKGESREVAETVSYLCAERAFGPIRRSVRLPAPVDENKTRAVYREGVLRVTMPKLAPPGGRIVVVTEE